MKFFTNSEFSADIADIIREYFPNEKLEKAEADENCQLSFFVQFFDLVLSKTAVQSGGQS